MTLNKMKLFDPTKPNKPTALINKQASMILNWNDIRDSKWFVKYKKLLSKFWTPFEINLSKDIKDYPNLTDDEREAFRKIIGLLAILDSVQPSMLSDVPAYLSDSAVAAVMIILLQQEVVHNHSYSYILASVETLKNQNIAFETARNEPSVYERNQLILQHYDNFRQSPNLDNFVKMLISSIVLEGINFYSAFAFFYNLARNQKMVGTSTLINYINMDELNHTIVITDIINELKEVHGNEITFDVEEFAHELFKEAVEKEIEWSNEVLAKIPEIDLDELADFIKYRANKCLSMIDIEPLYEGVDENSMGWINKFLEEGEYANKGKSDFFEQKSRQYGKTTDDNGFDDL